MGHDKDFLVATEPPSSMSQHSFPVLSYSKCRDMAFPCHDRFGCAWGSYVATKHFYVAIELAKAREKCVAIEPVYVATELATTESYVAHDRAGRKQVRCA